MHIHEWVIPEYVDYEDVYCWHCGATMTKEQASDMLNAFEKLLSTVRQLIENEKAPD